MNKNQDQKSSTSIFSSILGPIPRDFLPTPAPMAYIIKRDEMEKKKREALKSVVVPKQAEKPKSQPQTPTEISQTRANVDQIDLDVSLLRKLIENKRYWEAVNVISQIAMSDPVLTPNDSKAEALPASRLPSPKQVMAPNINMAYGLTKGK